MTSPSRYFVRLAGEVRGPFAVAQLAEMAEVGAVTPASEAAETREGPWIALEQVPEREIIFPARRVLEFKPTAFESLNTSEQPPVDLRETIAHANRLESVLEKRRAVSPAYRPPEPPPGPANEVESMVRDVAAREAQFAPPLPPPPKRKLSRHAKFVLALGVVGNAVLIALPSIYQARGDQLSMAIFSGWMVLFNIGIIYLYVMFRKV